MKSVVLVWAWGLLGSVVSGATAASQLSPVPADAAAPRVPAAVRPFDLADVALGPGLFRDAQERNRAVTQSNGPTVTPS